MTPGYHKKLQRFNIRWMKICIVLYIIISNLYYLTIWYRIPHKEIFYKIKIAGCIGYPTCGIYLGMDYSEFDVVDNERLGAILLISHPFRKHSPYLFKGVTDHITMEKRTDRYKELYEPLLLFDSTLCNKISTVYSTRIDISSNLYDGISSKDDETWSTEQLLTTRKFKSRNFKHNGISSENWYYLHRLPDSSPHDEGSVILCSQLYNTYDNSKPRVFSKGDISKLDCIIKLDLDSRIECDSIIINTFGPVDLKSINITPDNVSFNQIEFNDKNKIKQIINNGLRFYAEFPEAQKIQNIRIAILILFLPFWLTLLFKLIIKEIQYLRGNITHRSYR